MRRRFLEGTHQGHPEEDKDGDTGGLRRAVAEPSQGRFPVRLVGQEPMRVQAEGWHGPVGFGNIHGCTEKGWTWGKG